MNGATPRYLTNHLNTNDNDNPVYKTRTSNQNNIEGLGQELSISNKRFFLSVSMNGTN